VARLGLYQPFIEDRNVRRLYQLKVTHHARTGRKLPMTALVNRILDDFFEAGIPLPPGEGDARPLDPDAVVPLLIHLF
jgi:predicted YcjX-like family ATPase